MSTAFVLSGGASLGAIQAGMLQALYEREIAPELILGTSAGAINGSFIASRPSTPETAGQLGELWRGIKRSDIFPLNPIAGFFGFMGRRSSMVSADGLLRKLESHLEFDRLEEARVPLHVIVTDLFSGVERRLSARNAAKAVLASSAIPGIFESVEWEGSMVVDGGVSNNAPITQAIELGAERIYVLPTGIACALKHPPKGAMAMALHAMSLLVNRRLVLETEVLKDQVQLIVLPPPCPSTIQPIDFDHADELITGGYEGANRVLNRLPDDDQSAIAPSFETHSH